jgi:chorismate mutase / prephenate dehydratase
MTILEYRKNIDSIDKQILALLNERAQLALKIGEEKLKHNIAVESREREEAVMINLFTENMGPLLDEDVYQIYQSIMFACRNLQHVLHMQAARE